MKKKEGTNMASSVSRPHFVIFPFMSQGHTIPLLHLARLLHRRSVSVTIFTTPANSPAIRASLHNPQDISIIDLPFPNHIAGIPPGVQSTDKLPSISSFVQFANATKLIQPHFEQALLRLRPLTCIISDGFLPWTQDSAAKLGIPRLVSYGFNIFAMTLARIMHQERPHFAVSSLDDYFPIPNFPNLKLTRNDFNEPFSEIELAGELFDLITEQVIADSKSHGVVVNSFYELEPSFNDYWNQMIGPKAWSIGPLCLAKPQNTPTHKKPRWIQWLDSKLAAGQPVMYVAFGSQAELPPEQLREITKGLEESKVCFLWVLRSKEVGLLQFLQGFEERVKERGMVVKEWVDQVEILEHEGVIGFMSHCGWNSVTESICASVPILAVPLMAEQHMNARMVVEEVGVGLRVWPENGSARGVVRAMEVEKMVREMMEGRRGEEVRKKVKEVSEIARGAMKEGGSSFCNLDMLIHEIQGN